MKKFYLFFTIIIAISISSFAQDQRKASFNESLDHKNLQLSPPFNSSSSSSSTVIWQNDFSDASDWIFSNSSDLSNSSTGWGVKQLCTVISNNEYTKVKCILCKTKLYNMLEPASQIKDDDYSISLFQSTTILSPFSSNDPQQ